MIVFLAKTLITYFAMAMVSSLEWTLVASPYSLWLQLSLRVLKCEPPLAYETRFISCHDHSQSAYDSQCVDERYLFNDCLDIAIWLLR